MRVWTCEKEECVLYNAFLHELYALGLVVFLGVGGMKKGLSMR
jgi:hypothetical protein